MTFFWSLYNSTAEAMPDKLQFTRTDLGGIIVDGTEIQPSGDDTEEEIDIEPHPTDAYIDSSDEEDRVLHGASLHLAQQHSLDDVLRAGPGSEGGPRRYLPPGRPIELWWQYAVAARESAQKVASFKSFLKVFHYVFGRHGVLKFRKRQGDHAKCTHCEGYKEELRMARSVVLRAAILKDIAPQRFTG